MNIFKGALTALITPMNADGTVDFDGLRKNVKFQLEEGIDGLVPLGTTAETPTLDELPGQEEDKLISIVMEEVKEFERSTGKHIPVILGAGSNNTKDAVAYCERAKKVGADAALVVTPYYNKATQNGLVKMFETIADASTKPVILYNVPSRTGVNIEPETYARLAEHPMITGIKEANGNIAKIVETKALVGDKLDIWSGNDDQIVPILAAGGSGVISVLSNVLPKKTVELCNKFFAGDVKGSMDMQCEMFDLIKALFCEVNPIPVKAAVAALGYCENYVRLPLTPMEKQHEEVLLECMRKQGLKV